MKRFWSFLCWIIGEGILLAGFLQLGQNANQDRMILNGIVSSIIYSISFINVISPIFYSSEQPLKKADRLGVRWFFTITYSLLAIGGILYFELINPVDLLTQIIVQLIFLSVLFMGLWGAFKPAKETVPVHRIKTMERNQLIMINNAIGVARSKAEKRTEVPAPILSGIKNLQEEARSLSPGNESGAIKMEGKIMLEINQINRRVKEEPLDLKMLQYNIKYCSKLFFEFRQIYSN